MTGQLMGEEISDITINCETLYFSVGGTATGIVDEYTAYVELTSDQLSDTELLEVAADGTFTFAAALLNGASYSVSVSTSNPEFYSCTLSGKTSGTIVGSSISDLVLDCEMQTYSIGGSVSLPNYGVITLGLYSRDGDGNEVLFDQAELNDWRGLGGGNWVFHNEMPRGYNWTVRIDSIEGYDSCTPDEWSEDNLRWNIDWVDIECDSPEALCTIPDWMPNLVTAGFPESIYDQLKICGDQYYYNDIPTCVGGGGNSDEFCDGESFVCGGTLGTFYGSMDRQVDLLLDTLGVELGCLPEGETCEIGDECCSPYSDCYWKNDGTQFVRQCMTHEEARENEAINTVIPADPTHFTHPACPPSTCTAVESYALDPFKGEALYCLADDGIYYMNGMSTCQTATDTLTATYFLDFEFGTDLCQPENLRDFDVLLDDNIYVVNGTATYYQGIVDDALQNCCVEDGSFDSDISGWETEIAYIDTQKDKYSNEIQEKLSSIVSQARDLLVLLQATSSN